MQPAPPLAWARAPVDGSRKRDDDGVGEGGGDVDALAVAADRHPLRRAQGEARSAAARRFGDAAGAARGLRQPTAGRVAVEDRHRVAEERADVDVPSVRADDDHVRADQRPAVGAVGDRQPGDAAGAGRKLGERAGGAVAVEDADGVAGPRGRVDVAAVGADRDRVGAVEPDCRRAATRAFHRDAPRRPRRLAQRAGLRVAPEDRDRVAFRGGDIGVPAVGADRDRARSHERAGAFERAGGPTTVGGRRAVDEAAARSAKLGQGAGRGGVLFSGRRRGRCERAGRQHQGQRRESCRDGKGASRQVAPGGHSHGAYSAPRTRTSAAGAAIGLSACRVSGRRARRCADRARGRWR